jgi:hypothetical protein
MERKVNKFLIEWKNSKYRNREKFSFPVGKVDMVTLRPMDSSLLCGRVPLRNGTKIVWSLLQERVADLLFCSNASFPPAL